MRILSRALRLITAMSILGASTAHADPYRLRADVFATAPSPTGLVVLSGQAKESPYLDAEALVWMGSGDRKGDVLLINVGIKAPQNYGDARIGRMMVSAGAVRPVHIDGALLRVRLPFGMGIEAFGGLPVEPAFASRNFNWLVGQRLWVRPSEQYQMGVSYLQRRDTGSLAFEELGVDGFGLPTSWLSVAGWAAFDRERGGISDARLSFSAFDRNRKLEIFGTHRSPSRLLPATSLFSALGDTPSDDISIAGFYRVAPRLDLWASASLDSLGGTLASHEIVRATLRLDDRGQGSLGLELRRQSAPDSSWTGVRTTARIPMTQSIFASTELELVLPDNGGNRGSLWPWGLLALSYKSSGWLELAGAVEAGASPSKVAFIGGLMRASLQWEKP